MKYTILFLSFFLGLTTVRSQELLEYSHNRDLTTSEVTSIIGASGPYDVSTYTVTYTMIDHRQEVDTVSGLVALPKDARMDPNLVVYCHGTSADQDDAPSNEGQGFPPSLFFASSGYAVATTDYIGLGPAANSFHPYIHAESEALAALYMIDVTYEIMDEMDEDAGEGLFIAGYSQGGHASMALQKMVETDATIDLDITAAAHGSGPYSLSEVMRKFILSGETYLPLGFIPNLIVGYEEAYGTIYEDLSDIFRSPFIPHIEEYIEGEIDIVELSTRMVLILSPTGQIAPRYTLTDTVVARLDANDPEDPIIAALRENNTYDFMAEVPTRMYYCAADEVVPPANSTFADSAMNALGGSDVEAVLVDPNGGHSSCAADMFPLAIEFFNNFFMTSTDNQIAIGEIKIFPNPVTDYLYVSDHMPDDPTVFSIYNMQSQLVAHGREENKIRAIDVSHLDRGMYSVQVVTGTKLYRGRFVKN